MQMEKATSGTGRPARCAGCPRGPRPAGARPRGHHDKWPWQRRPGPVSCSAAGRGGSWHRQGPRWRLRSNGRAVRLLPSARAVPTAGPPRPLWLRRPHRVLRRRPAAVTANRVLQPQEGHSPSLDLNCRPCKMGQRCKVQAEFTGQLPVTERGADWSELSTAMIGLCLLTWLLIGWCCCPGR